MPLTVEEMWEQAKICGFDKRINTSGKTPWRTLGAQLYVEIRDNPDSEFIQVSKRPVKFSLKNKVIKNLNKRKNYLHQNITITF